MPEYHPDEGPEWDAWNDDDAFLDDADIDPADLDPADLDPADLDGAFTPPPHQDDRIWRHPAEVAAEARAQAAQAHAQSVPSPVPPNPVGPSNPDAPAGRGRVLALVAGVLVGGLVIGGLQLQSGNQNAAARAGATGEVPFAVSAAGPLSAGDQLVDDTAGDETAWTDVVFARVAPGLPRIEIIINGETAMGGGIVLDDHGHVLTSAAFVNGASHIIVWTTDERHVATVVGIDQLTDVAVLAINAKPQPATLGTNVAVQPGQYALIADATDNAIKTAQITKIRDNAEVEPGRLVHGLIETDIPSESIRPGSAIFDEMGLVIGMTPGGASAGHVLPIDLADRVAREILEVGQASHAMLGIQGIDNEPGAEPGALVIDVVAGGSASTAGLQSRDLITNMNGYPIGSMDDLVSALRMFAPHEEVDLLLTRDGEIRSARVLLGSDTD